jgi:hypothetical protein
MSYTTLGGEKMSARHRSRLKTPARSFALVALAFATSPAMADDWPTLRQGLWDYQRTVGPKKVEAKRCLSPTEDMKRQNAMLEKNGCAISPIRRSGNTYTFDANCRMKMPGGEILSTSTSVLTVDGDSSYRVEVRGTLDGEPTSEMLVARRVGDCKE